MYLNADPEDYAGISNFDNPNNGFITYVTYSPENSRYTAPIAMGPKTHAYIAMKAENSTIRIPKQKLWYLYPMYIPSVTCVQNGKLKYLKGT